MIQISETTKLNLYNFINNLTDDHEVVIQVKLASKKDDIVFFKNTEKEDMLTENDEKIKYLETRGNVSTLDAYGKPTGEAIRYPIFNDFILISTSGFTPEGNALINIKTIAKMEEIDIIEVVKRLEFENLYFSKEFFKKIKKIKPVK